MLYYFHRALYKLGIYKKINLRLSARINNKNYSIPVINGFGYYHLLKHDEWFIPLLKRLFSHTNEAFVDVGMNIGQTLLKVFSVDPDREYFGFEPNPVSYYYCQKLVEANKINNCHLFPVGLFNKPDVMTLYMDTDISSCASVVKDFRKNITIYKKQINVPVFTGDEILKKYQQKIGILKADVEGAELEAITGTLQIIKRDLPFLILEILPVYNLNNNNGRYRKEREEKLLSILFGIGYSMFRVNTDNASLIELDEIEVHNDMKNTNYVFVHSSKKEVFGINNVLKNKLQ